MKQIKAVFIEGPGGVEKFAVKQIDAPKPQKNEVLVKHSDVGLNFIDVYHRSGLYPLPAYPAIIGVEAAGVVEEVGAGVKEFAVGDRVAYCTAPPGTYVEKRAVAEELLVKIPAGITDEIAAAAMVKGLTAWYLVKKTFKVKKGDRVLIHAAAGGVGLILCQWAKMLGAHVIGTVSSGEKAKLAKANGCDETFDYHNFAEGLKKTEVDVVYDSVGKDTFFNSLEVLKPLGMVVSYGQASGKIEPIDIAILQKKSLFLTRPSLFTYVGNKEDLRAGAAELFDGILKGKLKIQINNKYKLEEVATAHIDLEQRKTTGSSVLKI